MILLPAIDLREGRAVRLTQGDYEQETVYADDPLEVAEAFVQAGAAWLHVVDLDAALEGIPRNIELVKRIVADVPIKVEVSGGIRDEDAVSAMLVAGAARVVVGTRALADPDFVSRIVAEHGEKVAVGLDCRGSRLQARGWTEDAGELDPMIERLNAAGARCYIVTDVARDGMLNGPNLELLSHVSERTEAVVVASGGISSIADIEALRDRGVREAIIGKALYAGRFTLPEAVAAAGDQHAG